MASFTDQVVKDGTSVPVSGVLVKASQNNVTIATATTDSFGTFTITAPEGYYSFTYYLNGAIIRRDYGVPVGNAALAAASIIDVRQFAAIFDGRDNTAALQASINFAATSASKIVSMPAGIALLTATIVVPAGVRLQGQGRNATLLRKTADYGDMFQFGIVPTANSNGSYPNIPANAYQSGGARGFWAYHDYGTGQFPPNTTGGMTYPTTHGVIFRAYQPSHCIWEDLWLGNGKGQWASWGGVSNTFIGIESYGVYDPQVSALQEATVGWLFDGDLGSIPTDFDFYGCCARGNLSVARTATWPGGFTTANLVQNIGPRDGVVVRCAEGIRWQGGYVGAMSRNGVRLWPRSGTIVSDISFKGHFSDASGLASLMLDNSDGNTPTQVTWAPDEDDGQLNGLVAISDADSNLSNYSVIGLNVAGNFRAFVGSVFDLKRAAVVKSDSLCRQWNAYGYYNANAGGLGYDACHRLGDNCAGVLLSGWVGGGAGGDGSNSSHDSYAVRYTSSGNPARVTLGTIALGIGTTLSATL